MSRTTYLNLTLTDSDQLLFKDWRNIINGPDSSSNTQILDAFAGRFAAGTQGQVLVKKDSVNFNFEWRKLSTSELTNDSGFITKAVNDLSNYYDKTIVDTKLKDVLDQTLHIQIVQKLPEVPSTRVIYLVPSADPGEKNYYNEYIYIKKPDGTYAWELIGTTKIDLTNYYTKTQVDTLLAGKQTVIDTSNKLTSDLVTDENQTNKFVTSTEKTAWNNKVDKTSTANRVYGTDASGAQTTFDKESFGQIDDVKISRNGEAVSIVENKIATIIYETGLGTDSDNAATVTAIRAFVNSSIEAVAANYITSNSDGDAFNTRALLISGPWYYAGQLKTPTRNDYAVVIADEAHGGQSARYTYTKDEGATTGQWSFQYPFNMTFTQAQINALNSGITAAKVELYDAHLLNTNNPHSVTKAQVGLGNVDNKSEATIKTDFTGSIASGNTGFVTGGDAYTALQGKQATIDNAHKLSSDLVDDTNHSNKFVTETQRSTLANAITNDGIGTCTSETTTVSVWNGNYTGFTKYGDSSGYMYVVKMSNDPIALESLLGKTLGYKFMEAGTMTLSAGNTAVDENDPNVIIAYDTNEGIPVLYSVFADTTAIFDDITVPRGLYFIWLSHEDIPNSPWYATSLTGLSWTQTVEEVNQIARKFIPITSGNGVSVDDEGVVSFNGNDIIPQGIFTVLGVQERIDTPYGTLVEAGEDQHYVDQNIQMGFPSGLGKSLKLKSLGKLTDFDGTPLVSGTNDGTNWSTITLDGVTKNIPNGTDSNAVHYTADTGKTDTQKQQARTNINAQKTIDSSNKLASDLVDDTNQTNKFVTSAEKTTWNNKQAQLVSGSNIKTINNQSILGAGNLNVSGLPSAQTAGSGAIYNGTNWVAQTGYAYITGNAGGSISWVGEHTNPEMIISQTTFFADPYYNINNTTIPTRTGVVGGSYKYHNYSESTDTTVTITSNMLQTIQAWVDSWEDPDATVTGATNDDFIIDGYIFVLHNTVTITIPTEGSGAHIMPAGVWVYSYDEGTEGETIQNLTWLSTEVVHQFDTRFIPTQADSNAVHYTADSGKTEAEKQQARTNIEAASIQSVASKQDKLTAGEGIIITEDNVISSNGGALPSATAGQAMVHNGTSWTKQDNYGYLIPKSRGVIEWDGETTGRTSITASVVCDYSYLYKVSDLSLTKEALLNATATVRVDETYGEIAFTEETIIMNDLGVILTKSSDEYEMPCIAYSPSDNLSCEIIWKEREEEILSELYFPKAGIYFVKFNAEIFDYAVMKLVLTDPAQTIEWDEQITGREGANFYLYIEAEYFTHSFYKVSERTDFTVNDFIGNNITVNTGEVVSCDIAGENDNGISSIVDSGVIPFFVAKKTGNLILNLSPDDERFLYDQMYKLSLKNVTETGLYFWKYDSDQWVSKINWGQPDEAHKFDKRYMPYALENAIDTKGLGYQNEVYGTIKWDGDTTGLESFNFPSPLNVTMYKIHDPIYLEKDWIQYNYMYYRDGYGEIQNQRPYRMGTVSNWSNVYNNVHDSGFSIACSIQGGSMHFAVINEGFQYNGVTYPAGIYASKIASSVSEGKYIYFTKTEYDEIWYHKIDSVYLDGVIRYDASQSLNTIQKGIARNNISASSVSVSATGYSTETVNYITIDNVEKKIGGTSLPEVTTEDNGKFLMVVEGVWAKASVPNASGGEF